MRLALIFPSSFRLHIRASETYFMHRGSFASKSKFADLRFQCCSFCCWMSSKYPPSKICMRRISVSLLFMVSFSCRNSIIVCLQCGSINGLRLECLEVSDVTQSVDFGSWMVEFSRRGLGNSRFRDWVSFENNSLRSARVIEKTSAVR